MDNNGLKVADILKEMETKVLDDNQQLKVNELKEILENYLVEDCDAELEQVRNPETLIEDLDLDSIDMAEMILKVEDKFPEIKWKDDIDIYNIKTVGDVSSVFTYFIINE